MRFEQIVNPKLPASAVLMACLEHVESDGREEK